MRTNYVWQIIGAIILTAFIAGCGGGGSSAPEGSIQNPINLGFVDGVTSLTDSIPAYGDLFYRFTTGPAGIYTITISGIANDTSDLTWDLYADPSYYYTNVGYCDNPSTGNVSCDTDGLSANTPYYLVISEWNTQATSYTLTVQSPL